MSYYVKPFTVDWNNEESDSLHLAYSYDKEEWYNLNGNNGILFLSEGSKQMKNPSIVKNSDGYAVYVEDAKDSDKIYKYTSKNLIDYTLEGKVESYAGQAGEPVEVTENELKALQSKWGKPEPVFIVSTDVPVVYAKVGENVELPNKVEATFSNNAKEMMKTKWSESRFDKAGEYDVEGEVSVHQYTNPIIYHRADPFVYKHTDGYYYFTGSYTDMEHNLVGEYQYIKIILRRAKSLEALADDGGDYEENVVYKRTPLPGNNSPHIWAPEIHFINGKWYIYFTTVIDENEMWSIRPHVMECADANPLTGTWNVIGQVKTTTTDSIAFTDFSLDHSVLQHNGELYFFWAEKHPEKSDIYVAKMVNPWTIDSSKITKVVGPEYNWELHGFPVCEGPGFLVRHGKIFMTYSASGTDALYCIGMMTADENADLLDPKSWTKSPYPVFQSSRATGQFGPGHNSFSVDEDGNDVMIYHARQEERYLVDAGYQPLYDAGRNATLMRIFWNADGTPNFSVPIPSGKGKDIVTKVKAKVIVK